MPLFLSGGVDSASMLAAVLALGKKPPHVYTFRLGEVDSADAAVARKMCAHFAVPHTVVSIPYGEETLVRDIKRVLAITHNATKTHVQCSQPFLYLSEAAHGDGFTDAAFGMAAGELYGLTKGIAMHVRTRGEAWCREERRKHVKHPHLSDWNVVKTAAACGITLHDPYWHDALIEFMLACDYKDIHAPIQKSIALRAFAEFWSQGAWRRDNSSLQLNSGIREWHDTLLQSPLNTTHAKAVVAIYRRMLAQFEVNV